jgi:hypothetical protein
VPPDRRWQRRQWQYSAPTNGAETAMRTAPHWHWPVMGAKSSHMGGATRPQASAAATALRAGSRRVAGSSQASAAASTIIAAAMR